MIKFDKMKLITSIDYISDINVSVFLTSVKNDEVLSTYSGAYPFTFRQLIKHKNSL